MSTIIVDVGVIAGILALCEMVKNILKSKNVWEKIRKWYFILPIILAVVVALLSGSEDPLRASFVWIGGTWAAYNAAKIGEPTAPSAPQTPQEPPQE